MMKKVEIRLPRSPECYNVDVGHDVLSQSGNWAKQILSRNTRKVVIFTNERVFSLYGAKVKTSLESKGFDVSVWKMRDGETHKNFDSLQSALEFFGKTNLARNDAVICLGGGVVGDLAGFASAIYLRGVQFLQIPTTLLSMIDSSVGGKTAINSTLGKNTIGAFYQPRGVLIDASTLSTLDRREIVAGFCEAIKQGAIGSKDLLNDVAKFLRSFPIDKYPDFFGDDRFLSELESTLIKQISFKASVVVQDEVEQIDRTDKSSRKILNFGHTVAHALEKVTNYTYFKHGEAVGYGILVAADISKRLEMFHSDGINLLNDVVSSVGRLPSTGGINIEQVIEAFSYDKKNLGTSLQWILLDDIGKPRIVEDIKIPPRVVRESLANILTETN